MGALLFMKKQRLYSNTLKVHSDLAVANVGNKMFPDILSWSVVIISANAVPAAFGYLHPALELICLCAGSCLTSGNLYLTH